MRSLPRRTLAFRSLTIAGLSALALTGGLAHAQHGDTVFTPLPPCRVVDSRIGLGTGVLPAGQVRTVLFRGKCGIPGLTTDGGRETNQARALALNVIAVAPSGAGHLTAWPANQAQPASSIINYTAAANVANGVIVPMCDQFENTPCSAGDVSFQAAVSSTHLVVDVTGYYAKPTLKGFLRHGAGAGADNFLCLANGIRFGLTNFSTTWATANLACPAGSWVCTSAERSTLSCATSRPNVACDARGCGFECIDEGTENVAGWTATPNDGASGLLVDENGQSRPAAACQIRPVWCCSPDH